MVWEFSENYDLELDMSIIGSWKQTSPITLLLEILAPSWDRRFLYIFYLKMRFNWASCILAVNLWWEWGRGRWFANWLLYMECQEILKKEADHSRSVGGKFNKQGNLLVRPVLCGCKVSTSLSGRKVYTVALTGFSYMHSPDGLRNTLHSQGCVLGIASFVGKVGRVHIPRTGVKAGEWGKGM